jgi:glycosyltransferase involved in cell wall biosynthesis
VSSAGRTLPSQHTGVLTAGNHKNAEGGSHVVFDLTRLLWRAEWLAPTGIERVELAYARYLIATARDRLSFVGWWGRFGLLPDNLAIVLVEALDALWSGDTLDRLLQRRTAKIAWQLRRHLFLGAGKRPMYSELRADRGPLVYLLVSHHHLHQPAVITRFKERTGARFVIFVHDLIPIEYPEHVSWKQPERHHRRMEAVARLADSVIVNSRDTAVAFRRYFAERNSTIPVVVAPLGIDLGATPCVVASRSDRPYFVYIARIEPRKNHRLLLEVWHRLARRLGTEAPRLVLVGRRGWKNKQILAPLRRSPLLQGLVDEHTRLPDAAVARLLVGACAAVFPSLAEGFGLPVAEALALGVPVLCSSLPALREVGREVPEYLDPSDLAGWEEAIIEYAKRESLRRQGQLNRLAAWRAPSWDEHFKKLEPLINRDPPRMVRRQRA